MKVTITHEYSIDMNYRNQYHFDIPDDEFRLLQSGEHPEYGDLDDWAMDQDLRPLEPFASEEWPGDCLLSEELTVD